MLRPSSHAAAAAVLLSLALVALPPATAETTDLPGAAPILPLSEVEPGMSGHGLSVFEGSLPERFEVEVLGVMREIRPDTSYILARLSGRDLEETGVIAGMSGSPVYLEGGRLAGAVAFAWPFSRGAIAGITPIEQMRGLVGGDAGGAAPAGSAVVTLEELLGPLDGPGLLTDGLALLRPELPAGGGVALQWSAAGFGQQARRLLAGGLGELAPAGLGPADLAPAGSAPAGRAGSSEASADLVPGAAVSGVLVDGDLRLAATGTVTDRIGDRVLAFGHPFLGLGPVEMPMAPAHVITVLSSRFSSFKIATPGTAVGAFELDRQPGIRGTVGRAARTIPMTVAVRGVGERDFRLELADIPLLVPTLAGISAVGSLGATTQVAGEHGVDLELGYELTDGRRLEVDQSFDGSGAAVQAAAYLMGVTSYLVQNELAEVELERIDASFHQTAAPRTARLVGAHASQTVVEPGEKVTLNLDLVAHRGAPFRHALEVELPRGLPAGRYSLLIGDGPSLDAARLQIERTVPVTFDQALELLSSLHSRRELVVLGVFSDPGLSVAGEALPQLPASLRSIWDAAASGAAAPLRLAIAQEVVDRLDVPLEGALRIDLEVRRREPMAAGAGDGAGDGEDGETGEGGAGEAGDGGGAGGTAGEAHSPGVPASGPARTGAAAAAAGSRRPSPEDGGTGLRAGAGGARSDRLDSDTGGRR